MPLTKSTICVVLLVLIALYAVVYWCSFHQKKKIQNGTFLTITSHSPKIHPEQFLRKYSYNQENYENKLNFYTVFFLLLSVSEWKNTHKELLPGLFRFCYRRRAKLSRHFVAAGFRKNKSFWGEFDDFSCASNWKKRLCFWYRVNSIFIQLSELHLTFLIISKECQGVLLAENYTKYDIIWRFWNTLIFLFLIIKKKSCSCFLCKFYILNYMLYKLPP